MCGGANDTMYHFDQFVREFWDDIFYKRWGTFKDYFREDAVITLYTTKETFNVPDFIHLLSLDNGRTWVKFQHYVEGDKMFVLVLRWFNTLAKNYCNTTCVYHMQQERIKQLHIYCAPVGRTPSERQRIGIGNKLDDREWIKPPQKVIDALQRDLKKSDIEQQ